ncbi:glycosyltransferase [Oceanibium sediminis]|uniref:glycosyltransferase n=1 Tax=Oceanibium sediminis TaxID=2026339 RepID=UPI000DD2F0FF|nr:glycosyltransferase [Oceanibium sediminis]
MKRVAIIAHTHPQFTLGGGELAAHRHFSHLRALGIRSHFVGMTVNPKATGRYFGDGQRVLTLGAQDHVLLTGGMDGFSMEFDQAEDEQRTLDFLLSLNADIYHFHHIWNVGAGTIRRLRAARPDAQLILTLHEYAAICANHGQMITRPGGQLCSGASPIACAGCFESHVPFDFVLRKQRLREVLDQFDLLISPSHFLRERFEQWGVPQGRIAVLENGLPASPAPLAETLETLDTKSRSFAFFGTLTPTKGLDVLLRATDWATTACGAQDLSLNVFGVSEEQARGMWPGLVIPDNVRFRGRYRPEDAVELMSRVGWLVVPSVWWENAPVVIQEARAARTPVIASDIGGMAEKTQGFGLQCPPGDPYALGALMAEVSGNAKRLLEHKKRIEPPLDIAGYHAAWDALCDGAARADAPRGGGVAGAKGAQRVRLDALAGSR